MRISKNWGKSDILGHLKFLTDGSFAHAKVALSDSSFGVRPCLSEAKGFLQTCLFLTHCSNIVFSSQNTQRWYTW